MNGDSKLLTLAALGVIGLGSAMPYWSAWSAPDQAPPEISTAQPAAPQPAAEPQFTAQQYWDQQVSRPDVVTLTPRGGQSMGLDNPAQIPSLSMDMQQATPVAAQPILANVPINQVGSVSLASRVEDMNAPKTASHAVVPIEIPGSAKPLPPTVTSPVITTRQVMKPELPETQVQQQFTPLPRIAPPSHGASNSGSAITREHRVRDGDSLESIAEKYLGDPLLADTIFRANRSQLDNPELLPIGITLAIPSSAIVEEAAPEIDGRLRPMTRLRPVSTAADPRGGDQPWTTLSPPGT
ncbi:LysM peptidoglycan-binding domain-containing protein [Bremerella sp. P1]|uniref:LysM peptidoglycan-binding domain-containing protein n=1 Tax=Bremerella sp. P1 TaxID=3026424 RepID=UPI002368512C|nr:LysM domain-containing protein [Bremerella sp. P1]WDI42708.1 LysM domain-containing protein [Bremerella sp. P1]